jgi:hypothetical protein
VTRAWTLGYPPAYDEAVRIPGNTKSPGGIVFSTAFEAVAWATIHADDEGHPADRGPGTWAPYQIELPNGWEQDTTTSRRDAWMAYHDWHLLGTDIAPRHRRPPVSFDMRCGICMGDDAEGELPHQALRVEAAFINPDTGEPA